MIYIETQRLRLRTLTSTDAAQMFDYRNSEVCSRYQRGQTKELPAIQALIQRRMADIPSLDAPFMLAVARKANDLIIGEIVVMPNDGTVSLGYTFHYAYHRQGYAFEALSALLKRLHAQYPEWDFISFTDPDNEPSMGLLRKLGYQDMGYLPAKESRVFGKWLRPTTVAEISQAVQAAQAVQ